MAVPTIEDVRRAKEKLREMLHGHPGLAAVGIGRRDGKWVVQVRWRTLPPEEARPAKVGDVDVSHQEAGVIEAQRIVDEPE